MAFIEFELRTRSLNRRNLESRYLSYTKSAESILLSDNQQIENLGFDIFLSHRKIDADLVLGIKDKLEKDYGKTVYVDWINDPKLNRSEVNKETAALLRKRMRQSKCLMFVHTQSSGESKWMPWELGYMDGHKPSKSTILPVLKDSNGDKNAFKQQEYLALYPPTEERIYTYPPSKKLFVLEDAGELDFDTWMNRKSANLGLQEIDEVEAFLRNRGIPPFQFPIRLRANL